MMKTSTPEEVGFHMNYNKIQLRKVIAQYPAKEIKKSLEQLYKRVDKHFSEEEGLLQVVWRGIQEEFIRQHEKMEDLIRQCYPDANVRLEFTIQDLLAMMSQLARKVNV
jgi:hemerythrin